MGAYLTDRKPVRQQWYESRRNPLTGCTALHTSESVMDTVGPDTGAENVAEFIRKRSDPGSYHDLVDSDSWIPLVDLKHAAFHDGTGSNNWALSLSFACRTTDWARMTPEKRRGFLRQGARAFANQQLYRRHIKAPLTRLRLISKAQSDRGESGLIYHGLRDPGRRTDPGVASPHLFPLAEFIAECRAELGRVMPDHPDADRPTTAAAARPAAQAPTIPSFIPNQEDPVQLTKDQAVSLPVPPLPAGFKAVLSVVGDSVHGAVVYSKGQAGGVNAGPVLSDKDGWLLWVRPGTREDRDVSGFVVVHLVSLGAEHHPEATASAVISVIPA